MDISSMAFAAPRRQVTTLRNIQNLESQTDLAAGSLHRLDGDNRWKVIVCRSGSVWVTQAYDPNDYVLAAGEMVVITQPGRVVVEALQSASVQISLSLETSPFAGDFAGTVFT